MAISNSSPKANPQSTDNGRSESANIPANAALPKADPTEISLAIDMILNDVDADRRAYITKRVEENRIKVGEITNNLHNLAIERTANNGDKMDNLSTRRMKEAIAMQRQNIDINIGSSSSSSKPKEYEHTSITLLVPGIEIKKTVRPIVLPEVEKLPCYATWNFMDRNQKSRNPTNDKQDKKEFDETEDKIIRMVIQELGSSDTVFDVLAQRMSRKPCEVKVMQISDKLPRDYLGDPLVFSRKTSDSTEPSVFSSDPGARYEALVAIENSKPEETDHNDYMSSFLDKHLEEAQSSFDNLFCLKCLIFNCKVHGTAQEITYPAKKLTWAEMAEEVEEEEKVPCGPDCYLQVQVPEVMKEDESKKLTDFNCWRTMEKDLFEKGLEIFGKESCLIARNLLGPLKTCKEVFHVLESYTPS